MIQTMPDFEAAPTYLTCAQTAKALRKALKLHFPGVKFSVRSSGTAIHLSWTDGPTRDAVEDVSRGFAGGGFDGSIDLAYNVISWLMPDGAIIAGSDGTTGSRGSHAAIINSAPHPDARLVRFGANYVFPERAYSKDVMHEAQAIIRDWRANGTLDGHLGYGYDAFRDDDRILALSLILKDRRLN
jgi:hypothetical protein